MKVDQILLVHTSYINNDRLLQNIHLGRGTFTYSLFYFKFLDNFVKKKVNILKF